MANYQKSKNRDRYFRRKKFDKLSRQKRIELQKKKWESKLKIKGLQP